MVKSVVCLLVMCLFVCADTLIGQIPKGTTKKKGETKNLGYLHSAPHSCISPQILQTKSTHFLVSISVKLPFFLNIRQT